MSAICRPGRARVVVAASTSQVRTEKGRTHGVLLVLALTPQPHREMGLP